MSDVLDSVKRAVEDHATSVGRHVDGPNLACVIAWLEEGDFVRALRLLASNDMASAAFVRWLRCHTLLALAKRSVKFTDQPAMF